MKRFRDGLIGAALLGLAIAAPRVHGAASVQAEVDALRTAYLDLNQGNHDYKGHRINALKQVEAACKLLGLNVSGDGNAKSVQAKSDAALRDAQSRLQAVRDFASANKQPEVLKHVENALKQIDMALKVK